MCTELVYDTICTICSPQRPFIVSSLYGTCPPSLDTSGVSGKLAGADSLVGNLFSCLFAVLLCGAVVSHSGVRTVWYMWVLRTCMWSLRYSHRITLFSATVYPQYSPTCPAHNVRSWTLDDVGADSSFTHPCICLWWQMVSVREEAQTIAA
jgi:hypothetical protein